LLNKPPAANNDDAFTQWRERVNDWRERVIAGMRDGGCTKQDVMSVNTLGLIPMIPSLHQNPGVAHAMSMLTLRLDRVADVAKKYGD
jgi:hypothetical protein